MREQNWFMWGLELFSGLFLIVVGLGLLVITYMYIADVMQTKQAVRHNYPVVGRFRYFFEKMGEFFRQYFLPSIGKNFPLIAPSVVGYIGRRKMLIAP